MAEEFTGFLMFRNAVKDFFDQQDVQEGARWEEALKILRANEHAISKPFKKMPRKQPSDFKLGIRIDRLEKMTKSDLKPANNIQDSLSKVA